MSEPTIESVNQNLRQMLHGGYTIELGENAEYFYYAALKSSRRKQVAIGYGKQPTDAINALLKESMSESTP